MQLKVLSTLVSYISIAFNSNCFIIFLFSGGSFSFRSFMEIQGQRGLELSVTEQCLFACLVIGLYSTEHSTIFSCCETQHWCERGQGGGSNITPLPPAVNSHSLPRREKS